jgi:hypothetical protein
VVRLFLRFGATVDKPKLTYLGYLNMLKPHFAFELGRDLLMRDTYARQASESKRETQEAVLLLLNELLLLSCICIAELEEMKVALMEEYMLNSLELREILGLVGAAPLRAIF